MSLENTENLEGIEFHKFLSDQNDQGFEQEVVSYSNSGSTFCSLFYCVMYGLRLTCGDI